jgi:hypothetical protein
MTRPKRPPAIDAVPAVKKYLDRHAEAEAHQLPDVCGPWENVVAIPACREGDTPGDAIRSLDLAARRRERRALIILVVNGRASAPPETHRSNAETIASVQCLGTIRQVGAGLSLIENRHSDVLLVDRSSEGRRFPDKQGVGLARKIGCDIGLALITRGDVSTEWIHTTDADAIVPATYFDPAIEAGRVAGVSALALPFRHHFPPHTAFGTAAALYELSLRYFVLGLRHARSPYAFQTIGSTMAFGARAYAEVRGFPRKEAGEDFYLLNKLAKVGRVASAAGAPIELKARPSDRVPFGTGVGVTKIEREGAQGQGFHLYHPRTFSHLRDLMDTFQGFAESGDVGAARIHLESTPWGAEGGAIAEALGVWGALQEAGENTRSPPACLKRIHTAFDAFRTRKMVHALRDSVLPPMPWREALSSADFLPGMGQTSNATAEELCGSLASLEEQGAPGARTAAHSRAMG